MAGIFLPGTSKGASGDITGVTAGDGLSGGGTSDTVTVTLDLNELTAAAVADGDFIPIIDTNDSNGSRKEAVHDLATLFSGDGLAATSSVMAVDLGTNPGLEFSSNKLQIAKGISQHDVAQFGAGVVDDDFLRVDGTTIEGRSASEVLSDISAAPAAGDGNILTVGALDSGSITSGFGAIDVGSSGITTTGAIAGGTIDASTDFTIGTLVITDDTITMTPSTNDTVTVAAATNGVLNITTVDNAAAAANLNFVVDGAVDIDAAGGINLDSGSGIVTIEDSGTEVLRLTESNSGDVTIKLAVDGKDLIFTDNGDATGLTIKDAAAGIVVPGEVMTTKVSYTDGDDAMTIADGGGVTFAQNIQTADIELGHASDTTLARSASGVVTIEGNIITTVGTENIWVPAAAMTPRDNAGCASLATVAAGTNGRPDFHVLDFDKDSDEHAQFTIAMPKSWDGGNVYFYAYWIGIAATTGVAWALQVLSLNDNEEFDQAYGTAVVVQDDSQGDATELLVSAKSGAIACSGADNDLLCFQVFRDVSDGNDDMSGDARLWGLLLEYTTNAATDA